MTDPQGIDVLVLASDLPNSVWEKLAHALGWPTPRQIARKKGVLPRAKWRNPYRNVYAGSLNDPDWKAAERLGLAASIPPSNTYPDARWSVTALGRACVRVRIEAARAAAQAERELRNARMIEAARAATRECAEEAE